MRVIDLDTGKTIFLDATPEFKADFEFVYARCPHSRRETRQKRNRGGAIQYIDQCLDCGDSVGMFYKHTAALTSTPVWDFHIEENFRSALKQRKVEVIQKHVRIQRDRTEGFWKRYSEYLNSSEWQQRRAKVLSRADGICEGCRNKVATQVHHLTYNNVCNEFLFELVAVCDDCHDRLHSGDEANNEQEE